VTSSVGGLVARGSSGVVADKLRQEAQFSSGIVCHSPLDFAQFSVGYLWAILSCNVYAHASYVRWGQGVSVFLRDAGIPLADISDLEPLNALSANVDPWTLALEGKKVAVVHPFRQSIFRGYEDRHKINGVRNFLPEFKSLEVIEPPVTFLDVPSTVSWQTSLETLTQKMSETDYDVAILGAGGYGLPAAAFAKACGKVAIHLGGATQLLFGIRGKRWESHPLINRWFDESWRPPTDAEHFIGHEGFEGGKGYW
jgi:hypothetical protein